MHLGDQYAPFDVPEVWSREFLDVLFKMARAFFDATPKEADYFDLFAVSKGAGFFSTPF